MSKQKPESQSNQRFEEFMRIIQKQGDRMGEGIAYGISLGLDPDEVQRSVFNASRDALIARAQLSPGQAASYCRLALNFLNLKHTGSNLYSKAELESILAAI